jgi:hypothetical protein
MADYVCEACGDTIYIEDEPEFVVVERYKARQKANQA